MMDTRQNSSNACASDPSASDPSARQAGFSLVEIAIALFVFGMITLLFGAVFPVASRAGHTSSNYAEAALIGQRKIDQCRQAGYANIYASGASAKLIALGVIDSPQPSGYPIVSGATTTYSFTSADNLVDSGAGTGFYSGGTTGTLTVSPVPAGAGWNAPPVSLAAMVTATIQWSGSSQGSGAYTARTIIRNY